MSKPSASNSGTTLFRELSVNAEDSALLHTFYHDLYIPEFPDPNERESLDNMLRYLELKAQGWYGNNNYHIVLMLEGERPVAGCISDYLATADAGVIEFLTVAPNRRRQGLGERLLRWTESTLSVDAVSRTARPLGCIVAEMHDPRFPDAHSSSLDPLSRARIWRDWGYRKLDFNYVQPPLSATQEAARELLLLAKIITAGTHSNALSVQQVRNVLHEYLVWAMRIDEPEALAEYREMLAQLQGRTHVDLIALDVSSSDTMEKPL